MPTSLLERDSMHKRVYTDKDLFRIQHWMNARATADRQKTFALTFDKFSEWIFPAKSTSLGASLRTKYSVEVVFAAQSAAVSLHSLLNISRCFHIAPVRSLFPGYHLEYFCTIGSFLFPPVNHNMCFFKIDTKHKPIKYLKNPFLTTEIAFLN